jgi:hypothetical protein
MDNDITALTVVPCGRGPSIAVTTATGVHTEAIASLNVDATDRSGIDCTSPEPVMT